MMEEIFIENRAEWRKWLSDNHLTNKGIWVIFNKKNKEKPYLTYDEGVEEALCFGWIDSKPGTVDAERSKQYYSPRNPKSNWSGLNKIRVEKLLAANLIMPQGVKMINLAKETGTWDALNDVENLVIPPDLEAEFTKNPLAKTYFEAFPKSTKRGILEWIQNAKTAPTRQKRITETVTLATENIRANQYVKK